MKTLRDITRGPKGLNARNVGAAMDRATEKLALLGQQRMRYRLSGPVLNRRSGNLMASAIGVVRAQGLGRFIDLRAGGGPGRVKYAAIHEKGGVILPKSGKHLVFKTARGWVSAKRVRIPKRPYIEPSRNEVAEELEAVLTAELRAAVGGP